MLKPEGYKVLVKPDKVEDKTDGGIYLPQQTRDNEQNAIIVGEIVAMGPKVDIAFEKDRPAKIGDRVLYARYGGFYWEDKDGEKYRILNDEDILGLE